MVKLNLGCGIYFKPGYVNIDKFESLVADQQADLFILPYDDNSVEEIEASHIIEHFDIVHIPYLLAEWWRVLKPGGILHIETPNLLRSAFKLHFTSQEQSNRTSRFLFGVDCPGNFHKSGFTYRTLHSFLQKNSFVGIKREKQRSFKTEPGMRISAIKSLNSTNLLGKLRVKIIHEFSPPNTMFYSAIETNVVKILQSQNYESFEQISTKISIFHPKIALLLSSVLPKSKQANLNIKLYKFMDKNDFPSLLYANWIKRAKMQKNFIQEYFQFIEYWSKRLLSIPRNGVDFSNHFSYLLSLEKSHQIDNFSLDLLTLESQKWCNVGIKSFQEENLESAKKIFDLAIRINPSNEIACWNLARIHGMRNNFRQALKFYQATNGLLRKRVKKKQISEEINTLRKTHKVPTSPLQIRY